MAGETQSPLPPELAEPVVLRLRQLADALDAPAEDFDEVLGALFDDLRSVAGAVGVLPHAA
jgi:hypothetical protein